MPRVSVLMPAYNSEKYVGAAIESILNQTFTDFEFIIINDGSTDSTAKIVRDYAKRDNRIKFIDNKKNRGIAKIRNQLLDVANGTYIAFQDSDDISLADRLEKQVRYLDTHKNITVVGGGMKTFPQQQLITAPENPKILDFYWANSVFNPTVMIRKSDIDSINLRYDETLQTAEDYDFWTKLVKYYNIHNMPDVLLNYRVLDTSLSHNNPHLDECNKKVQNNILNFLTSNKNTATSLSIKYRILLFGFLPLFKQKYSRIYLFDIIPLLKKRGSVWYLFDFIPLFTKR